MPTTELAARLSKMNLTEALDGYPGYGKYEHAYSNSMPLYKRAVQLIKQSAYRCHQLLTLPHVSLVSYARPV